MIVLNDKDESLVDETSLLELYVGLSGYEDTARKYVLSAIFRSNDGTRVYYYPTKEDALRDRNQIVELLQARKLNIHG